jgi:hypothetical protein
MVNYCLIQQSVFQMGFTTTRRIQLIDQTKMIKKNNAFLIDNPERTTFVFFSKFDGRKFF